MYDITYNGVKASSVGLMVKQRPVIPAPVPRAKSYTVPGRNGASMVFDRLGTEQIYEDILIEVTFSFSDNEYTKRLHEIKSWLAPSGRLVFSDEPTVYYLAKFAEPKLITRTMKRLGEMTVAFTCDPYAYLTQYEKIMDQTAETIFNPGAIAVPTYYITGGAGDCTLTVNNKTFVVTMTATDGTIIIDTVNFRAYSQTTRRNPLTTGSYLDLRLKPGVNEISVSEGYELALRPRFRLL